MRKTPITGQLLGIPNGKPGTKATLKLMRQLVIQGKRNIHIRQLALDIVKNNNQKDWENEAKELHEFVRDKIRYIKDINGIETIQTPLKTLEIKQGDCDDKSVLLATLLETIGHPVRFIAVGFSPDTFSHVLIQTKIGSKWISAETTEPWEFGQYPKNIKNMMIINI